MTRGERRTHGLGLYPDSPCFDPTRPSWLPYWIDDFQESGCFYNSSSMIGAMPNAAGQMAGVAVAGGTEAIAQGISSALSSGPFGAVGLVLVAAVVIMLLKK